MFAQTRIVRNYIAKETHSLAHIQDLISTLTAYCTKVGIKSYRCAREC